LLETYVDGDLAFTENSNIPLGIINIKSTSLEELENKLAENDILNENSMNTLKTIKSYLKKVIIICMLLLLKLKIKCPIYL